MNSLTFSILVTMLFLIGFGLIIDGIGSILLYWDQPWFPDHTVRIIRAFSGLTVMIIAVLLDR